MFESENYPQFLFYIFGIIGLIFLIKKPQYTFWMGIFYFAARELRKAAYTRIPLFGPYLNLDDFIILLMLISLVHYSFSRKIKMPSAAVWIAICIFSSILIIALNHSFIYTVQREHKAALYFLVGIFLGYNFITKEKDFETFLKFLFIGSMFASIQYIFLTQGKLAEYATSISYESIRSVLFISLIPSLLIASVYVKIKWLKSFSIRVIYFIGISLFIVNLALSQTRSFYIAIILTIFLIYIFRKEVKLKSLLLPAIIIPLFVFVIFDLYLNLINVSELIFGRLELLGTPSTDVTTMGRMAAIEHEFYAFTNSNIIFGNGLGFTFFLPDAFNPFISWGHVGHIAYLARLGLLGFIVYSIYIPIRSLVTLHKVSTEKINNNYTKIFILFAISLVISDWIQFWMSSSYLGITTFLSGIVIGIVWAIKDKRIILTKDSVENIKNAIPENQYSNAIIQPGAIPGTDNSVSY